MKRMILVGILATFWTSAVWAQTPVTASCGQNAQTLEGGAGATFAVTCPAGCGSSTIWGTGVYSDDSAICTAAIHGGALTAAGGTVLVTIAPGLDAYPASTANGISSSQWGSWNRSFTVAPMGVAVDCTTNAQGLAGDPGSSVSITCPAGCSGGGTVWGTGVYSDDSAVCPAAIHAGVLTDAGGSVTITIAPGQDAYPASTANGVSTSEWGAWSRSFTVSP